MHVTTSLSFVIISDYFQPLFYRIERLVSHTCICGLQASQGKALRFFGDVYCAARGVGTKQSFGRNRNGKLINTLLGHNYTVYGVAKSPDFRDSPQ